MNKRILLYAVLGLFVVGIFGVIGILNKMMNPDIEKLHHDFKELGFRVEMRILTTENGEIAFYQSGTSGNPKMLLIHGSPGDWTAWNDQFKDSLLQSHFQVLSYDRPGYGETNLVATANLQLQAEAALMVMDQFPNDRFVLVGHSYGGAVVEQLAIDNPERISHVVYVAPTLEPNAHHPKWFNQLAKVFKPFLSRAWLSSDIEMMGLPKSLLNNEERLSTINVSATWLMGERDMLVPNSTITYYKNRTTHPTHYLIDEKANHFIPWEQSKWLNEILLETKTLVEEVKN